MFFMLTTFARLMRVRKETSSVSQAANKLGYRAAKFLTKPAQRLLHHVTLLVLNRVVEIRR